MAQVLRYDAPPKFAKYLDADGKWCDSITFSKLFGSREEAEKAAFIHGCKMPQDVKVNCLVAAFREHDDAPPVPMWFEGNLE